MVKPEDIRIIAIIILHKDLAATPIEVIDFAGTDNSETTSKCKNHCRYKCKLCPTEQSKTGFSIHGLLYAIPFIHKNMLATILPWLKIWRDNPIRLKVARKFPGGKEVWISPVNIQRRFNANAGYYEQDYEGDNCPPQVDSRMMSLLGAGWTVGSLKYLIENGVKGITFFETLGERGIMQGDKPSRWPENFPSVEGMIFPVWFVFAFLLQNKSSRVIKSESTQIPWKLTAWSFPMAFYSGCSL